MVHFNGVTTFYHNLYRPLSRNHVIFKWVPLSCTVPRHKHAADPLLYNQTRFSGQIRIKLSVSRLSTLRAEIRQTADWGSI